MAQELRTRKHRNLKYLLVRSPHSTHRPIPPPETNMGRTNKRFHPPEAQKQPDIRPTFERPAAARTKMVPAAECEEPSQDDRDQFTFSESEDGTSDVESEDDSAPVTKGVMKDLIQEIRRLKLK
ncbi:Hypothetical predicted protein [Pelobates cultripes]|uniref:Uncharacterized protein n=1 Tax=Pelobates cultripes TaxID=61616 RepID=A0AAD1W1J9_PELCU|nr:Hypothetical predicted protein [Pelobates cultripes]